MDEDVTFPRTKGNFKGTHTPSFLLRNAKTIPMSEEESVEDMFRTLAERKSTSQIAPLETNVTPIAFDSETVLHSGYMEKEGRGTFSTWNNRCVLIIQCDKYFFRLLFLN